MNEESKQIIENARADRDAGIIQKWQYDDIVLSVMKAEIDERVVIYDGGDLYMAPRDIVYIPAFARAK